MLAIGINFHGWRGLRRRFDEASSHNDFEYALHAADLSGEALARVTQGATDVLAYYKQLIDGMTDEQFRRNAQFQTVPLVLHVLTHDAKQRSVVSIASCYGKVESMLAQKNPDVDFYGVDFPPNLAEVNAHFLRNNFTCQSAYPLHWLRQADEKFDVALFNRVLCIVSNAEVRAYLEALKNKARYIVFGEQTKLHTDWTGCNLDAIDKRRSRSVRHHWRHNYRDIFADHDFEMVHYVGKRSALTKEYGPQHFMVLGIARNVNLS